MVERNKVGTALRTVRSAATSECRASAFGWTVLAGIAALAAVTVLPTDARATARPTPGSTHFPRYKELEPNVAFWSDVFTKWSSRQIAFHDVEHLDLVYSVLSIDDIVKRLPIGQQDDAIRARRKAEGERITAMLVRIADGHARTEEERGVLKAIARIGHEPSYAQKLSEQVRSQRGLGDKFCEAAQRAKSYQPMMSQILRQYDVPQELLALPLVESGYKIGARSHAGASGIWQFMPATGRYYMEVGSAYDDRRDPRRSTEAAARMLRKTYENIGSWPLAITSYNHGPGGIARAVREMGTTHFGVISRHYKGKAFGFASRNYYAEFLAAADAMRRVDELCGDIAATTYQPDEAMLTASASIRDLARAARMSVEDLASLNPALGDSCARGTAKIPRGYRLNLPRGRRDEFAAAFKHVDRSAPKAPVLTASPDKDKPAAVVADRGPILHKVVRGETLGQIARRFGTTETTLLYMNKMRSASSLKAGQTIKVPSDRPTTPVAIAVASVEHPPLSRSMTTTAGIMAAKEAGQAASAAAMAAQTAAAVVPAAVIRKDAVDPVLAKEAEPPASASGAAAPEAAGQQAVEVASIPKDVVADATVAADRKDAAKADGNKDAAKADGKNEEDAAAADDEPMLTAEHKVARGQSLSQIAAMYHTTTADLMKRNGIANASSIQAGQTLKVRTSGSDIVSTATIGRTYKVRPGDTLWSVARRNDTSVETLKRLNPKIASGLRAGETIKVPSAGAVASATAVASAGTDKQTASKTSSRSVSRPTTAKAPAKPATRAASKPSYRSHRVSKGQTLSSIAQKYRTSVDTLKRINGIRDARNVQIGKTLKVPL